MLLASFGVFLFAGSFLILQILASRGTKDPSEIRGSTTRAVLYSLTGAMSPLKKESARRHIPTYAMGLVFHAGVFLSFFWLAIHFFDITVPQAVVAGSRLFLIVSSSVGLILFAKRIVKPKLRSFSNLDDYASNLMVVGFEAVTALTLFDADALPVSFIYASVLFLYIPLGKLRHAVYFIPARVYLGLFYGRRGVWGIKRRNECETQGR
jgi:hypothetical protein